MNISAIPASHIKEGASFGKDYQVEDIEHVMQLTKQLNDSFQKTEEPEHKSPAAICVSIAGAILTMFILGKCAASKLMTAFPSITTKLGSAVRKGANVVRDFSDDVAKGAKLQKGGKYTQFVGDKVSKAESFLRKNYIKLRDKSGAENLITNAAGLTAVAAVAPEVISVDGNNDGVSDIAQKNVNAYKNALKNVGIVSEIVDALA